ncbi:hypothetical protein LC983_13285, partial [Enterococcus faecium]|nr:hypothetical protein [Enterococcus faecium]
PPDFLIAQVYLEVHLLVRYCSMGRLHPSVLIDKEPKKGVDFSTPKKSNFWGSLQVDNSFLFTNQLDIYKLYFLTNFIDIKKLI